MDYVILGQRHHAVQMCHQTTRRAQTTIYVWVLSWIIKYATFILFMQSIFIPKIKLKEGSSMS